MASLGKATLIEPAGQWRHAVGREPAARRLAGPVRRRPWSGSRRQTGMATRPWMAVSLTSSCCALRRGSPRPRAGRRRTGTLRTASPTPLARRGIAAPGAANA